MSDRNASIRARNASASLICVLPFSSPGPGGGSYTDAEMRARRVAALEEDIVADRRCPLARRSDGGDDGLIESNGLWLDGDAAEGVTGVCSVCRRACRETNLGGGRGEDDVGAPEPESADLG